MSPVASGGPPHSRMSSVNGGGPVGTTNGSRMNGMDGIKGASRVFAHLDDLVSVTPDVDINSPIRKILQDGDLLAKQADTHLDFRRPDIALQEYVKASTVAIEIIPRHKDYTSLLSERGELHRLYASLTKRINAQHPKFAEVKKVIQENNARSGVQPLGVRISANVAAPRINGQTNGHSRSHSVQQAPSNSLSSGLNTRRKPPVVQPKPDSLHGNAITTLKSPPADTDLAARLSRLRSSESNPVIQDPRIRTQSISVPRSSTVMPLTSNFGKQSISKPYGPRDMPSVPSSAPRGSKLSLDMDIPGLPRPPDAIYNSPARNADNAAAANLPSSVVRLPSYHASAPPISTVGPTPGVVDNRPPGEGYFYSQPAHSVDILPHSRKTRKNFDIPDSTTVNAQDLMDYLRIGSHNLRLLLVDIRSREDFENGHIMSQSIICVEPITLRKGISGEQLGDSMIIAPDSEQELYEQRDEFDLVVFYDQSSSSVKPSGSSDNDTLQHFTRAVYEYGYDKQLKRRPMLLLGGLDAWIDLLGPSSLKASLSRTSSPAPNAVHAKSARPLTRTLATRHQAGSSIKRRKTHSSRPLSKEQEALWDKTLRADSTVQSPPLDEDTASDELVYAKTTEDFFRRYPELPPIQESMMTPPPPRLSRAPLHNEVTPSLPAPPARPPPALPRQRSSGLSERGPNTTYNHTPAAFATLPRPRQGLTGLSNPNVHCYMNAAIQALSATPFLRQQLLTFTYPPATPLPRKAGETSDPPQLMVRCIGNVFGHLWSGAYDFITPKTLGEYVNTVHSGKMTDSHLRSYAYGGSGRQHDSGEFMNFLLEILNDELNPRRNQPPPPALTDAEEEEMYSLPLVEASQRAWQSYTRDEDSIITRRMKGQTIIVTTCGSCNQTNLSFVTWSWLTLPIEASTTPQDIEQMIARNWGHSETLTDYACPRCKAKGVEASRTEYLAVLPDYLVIQISRYDAVGNKIMSPVTLKENGVDLTASFLPRDTDDSLTRDHRRIRPFLYDCYGAIMHSGATTGGGHWYTVTKSLDKPNDLVGNWHRFNDSNVVRVAFNEVKSSLTTVILLKRQGTATP